MLFVSAPTRCLFTRVSDAFHVVRWWGFGAGHVPNAQPGGLSPAPTPLAFRRLFAWSMPLFTSAVPMVFYEWLMPFN